MKNMMIKLLLLLNLIWVSPSFAIQVCDETALKQECVNRQVCRVVCSAAGGAAGAAVDGRRGAAAGVDAATEVCNNVCENVPECSQVAVCVRSHQEGP